MSLAKEIGEKYLEGHIYGHLGRRCSDFGEHKEAIVHYKAAMKISKSIGDIRGLGTHLSVLGSVYATLGEYDEAIVCFNQSLEIALEIGNKRSEGLMYGNLGDIYIRLKRWSDAENLLTQGIEVCMSIIPAAAGAFMGSLAWVYAEQSKIEEAKFLLADGEPLVKVYPEEYAKFLCKKAKIQHLTDESYEAQEALEQAESIAKKVNQSEDSELNKAIQEARKFLST